MLELNQTVFLWLNASVNSSTELIGLAKIVARYLVLIVPIILVVIWLWLPNWRSLAVKIVIALSLVFCASALIGWLMPQSRPFVVGLGTVWLDHKANASFPSNHAAGMFVVAWALLFWHRWFTAILAFLLAFAVAWSRIYLGVHWPIDMLGSFVFALASCILTQYLWQLIGNRLLLLLELIYHWIFYPLIKIGLVKK